MESVKWMGNEGCNPSSLVSNSVSSVGGSICIRIVSINVIIPACLYKLQVCCHLCLCLPL